MSEQLKTGDTITIQTKRVYGPYLDGRKKLPIGKYKAEVMIHSVNDTPVFSIVYDGNSYILLPEDTYYSGSFCK